MTYDRQDMRNLRKALIRTFISFLFQVFARLGWQTRSEAQSTVEPRRILLLNGLHIGDVIIATSIIPVLRRAYPNAQIGFLTGSWSQMVVTNHPDISFTHQLDHWKIDRGPLKRFRKLFRYWTMRSAVLEEIRALHYDVAISLFTNHPDFLDLTWQAGIPVRIGFSESIFAGLATALVDEPNGDFITHGERLGETLRALPIDPALLKLRSPSLPPDSPSALKEAAKVIGQPQLHDARYCIIHMGSGATVRELPISFWRELAAELSQRLIVVFTGRGNREDANIERTTTGLDNCINACNQVSWEAFVALVRHAQVLYGVESMAGHLAGALNTPCAVVYGGTAGVGRWRPEGQHCIVFTNHVSCAPCLQAQGCAAMTCMKGIAARDLIQLGPAPTIQDRRAGPPRK